MGRKRTKQYNHQDNIGIYGIYCGATNKWYIGASTRLESRTRKHILDLQNSRPHVMAEDVKKYGMESIKLYILEKVTDQTELSEREQYWMDKMDSVENGYNQMRAGRGSCWFPPSYSSY